MSSIEENKETLRKYVDEVLNKGDYTNIDLYMHDDFNGKPAIGSISGKEAHKQSFKAFRAISSDAQLEIRDLIAEGDKVVIHGEWTGTHTGEFPRASCHWE